MKRLVNINNSTAFILFMVFCVIYPIYRIIYRLNVISNLLPDGLMGMKPFDFFSSLMYYVSDLSISILILFISFSIVYVLFKRFKIIFRSKSLFVFLLSLLILVHGIIVLGLFYLCFNNSESVFIDNFFTDTIGLSEDEILSKVYQEDISDDIKALYLLIFFVRPPSEEIITNLVDLENYASNSDALRSAYSIVSHAIQSHQSGIHTYDENLNAELKRAAYLGAYETYKILRSKTDSSSDLRD